MKTLPALIFFFVVVVLLDANCNFVIVAANMHEKCLQGLASVANEYLMSKKDVMYFQECSYTCTCISIYLSFNLSPIRMCQKYTRVNILRCANFTRGKQMAHANANTHRSIFTYGYIYSWV